MTTTLSIHTKEADPDQAFDSLKRAMALIKDIRAIPGLRVVIHGDHEPGHHAHPGEQHKFETRCTACGENGILFVAILGPNEKATISEA